jgi:hypothetical protein
MGRLPGRQGRVRAPRRRVALTAPEMADAVARSGRRTVHASAKPIKSK